MPYSDIDLGQHSLRWLFVTWWHWAIIWTNVDSSSIRYSDIHLGVVSLGIPQSSITKFSLKLLILDVIQISQGEWVIVKFWLNLNVIFKFTLMFIVMISTSVKFCEMDSTGLYQWLINVISGNALVLSGNRPLHKQMLPQFRDTMWSHHEPVNPLRAKFFRDVFTFSVISPHWCNTGIWNPSSNKTRTYLFYIVNIMAADVLAT